MNTAHSSATYAWRVNPLIVRYVVVGSCGNPNVIKGASLEVSPPRVKITYRGGRVRVCTLISSLQALPLLLALFTQVHRRCTEDFYEKSRFVALKYRFSEGEPRRPFALS
jgi:hypothetical protein